MAASEDTFARLVSLAVHDLRTPLATVAGFARTLQRDDLEEPKSRYVEFMIAATDQLAELLDDLGIAARIKGDRWEPNLQEVSSWDLAGAVAAQLPVDLEGSPGPVRVDRDACVRAIVLLCRCALRHGGLERVRLDVNGPELSIGPIPEEAVAIVAAVNLRDLGAAVGVTIVNALGGRVEAGDTSISIFLPPA